MPRAVPFLALLAGLLSGLAAAWLSWPDRPPQPAAPRLLLEPARFDALPGWRDDAHGAALAGFLQSCRRLARLPDDRSLGAGGLAGEGRHWKPLCAEAAGLPSGDAAARDFFERGFRPFQLSLAGGREGLFTGYYESALRGSRSRHGRYDVPLHVRPPELVMAHLGRFRDDLKGRRIAGRVVDGTLEPYFDRAAIVSGALAGRDLELVWVDDAIDAFFVQVQGSGRIDLDDGSVLRIGYAGQNGHPYFAIGRELVKRGALDRKTVSLQSIRAWLAAHPDEAAAVMNRNPSYVFFREMRADEGPFGALGVPLTPGRSLAVDRQHIPLGVPLWFDGEAPDPAAPETARPLRRLLMAQDVGGAIRGALRGDVFWGYGAEAERIAGHMKHRGRLSLLLPAALVRERAPLS